MEFGLSRYLGRARVAHLITSHEQYRLSESTIYISLVYSFVPEDLTIQNLFIYAFIVWGNAAKTKIVVVENKSKRGLVILNYNVKYVF